MFAPDAETHISPSDEYIEVMTRAGDRFPYSIPFGFSGGRNDTFRVRHRVYYCLQCERDEELAFARYRK
jgi:hypothetical protein